MSRSPHLRIVSSSPSGETAAASSSPMLGAETDASPPEAVGLHQPGATRLSRRKQDRARIGSRLLDAIAEAAEASPALERALAALSEARALATWCGPEGDVALQLAIDRTFSAFNDLGLAAAAVSIELAPLVSPQEMAKS